MTIEQILSGETRDRSNDDARARIPMTAPEVRHCIASRIEATGNQQSAASMARLALRMGNLAPCGRALYEQYIEASA
jgi:hypothetical protein